jgi:hypothetical protein
MMDAVFVAVTLLFFVLATAYAVGCDRLKSRR